MAGADEARIPVYARPGNAYIHTGFISFCGVSSMAAAQHEHGKMDISQHREMWGVFLSITKWGTGIVIAILVLMAIFLL